MSSQTSSLTDALSEAFRPLEREEEGRAVIAARDRIRGGRVEVYGVELRIEKRRGERPTRLVSVLLGDLDDYAVHEVVVDDGGEVIGVEELVDFVPPFTSNETADAIAIARGHADLQEVAARWGVETATSYPPSESSVDRRERRARLVTVRFLDTSTPNDVVPVSTVVVNLSGRAVISVEHH